MASPIQNLSTVSRNSCSATRANQVNSATTTVALINGPPNAAMPTNQPIPLADEKSGLWSRNNKNAVRT